MKAIRNGGEMTPSALIPSSVREIFCKTPLPAEITEDFMITLRNRIFKAMKISSIHMLRAQTAEGSSKITLPSASQSMSMMILDGWPG
jgi:hypothetical protein